MKRYAKAHKRWSREQFVVPLLVTEAELTRPGTVFPLEYLEIQEQHRVLWGRDPFIGMHIDRTHLAYQVQQGIQGNLVRLRQRYIEGGGTEEAITMLLPLSLTALLPCLRGLQRIAGQPALFQSDALLAGMRTLTGLDLAGLTDVLELKRGIISPGPVEVPRLFERYAENLEALIALIRPGGTGIRVGHVEAGLRSYDRTMPEEINRILTDHLSDHLFAPTEHARRILLGEGIGADLIHVTGNTVVDEVLRQRERARTPGLLERFGVSPGRDALATTHRAENVDHEARLRGIFAGLADTSRALGIPVLAALHPRTSKKLETLGIAVDGGVRTLPPLGYHDFLGLHAEAALTLTDSGGLQEEACCLRVPCVTLRDNTERPESVEVGANLLAGAEPARILAAARTMAARARDWPNPFGDGRSGPRIVDFLLGSR